MAEEEVKSESKYPLSECVVSVCGCYMLWYARGEKTRALSAQTLEHTSSYVRMSLRRRRRQAGGSEATAQQATTYHAYVHVQEHPVETY